MPRQAALSRLVEDYCCPKCHNRACFTEEVTLASSTASTLTKVLGLGQGRYLVVTCSLCGYSEIYNLRILVEDREKSKAPAAAKPAAPAPPGLRRAADKA